MRFMQAMAFLLGRVVGATLLLLVAILLLGALGIAADHQQLMGLAALAIVGAVAWRTPTAFRNRSQ
jgi:hypothetical protein